MRKIITLILVAGWVLTSYSQEVIQLEETTLTFEPTGEIVFEDYENGIIRVKEKFQKQFQSDAVNFVNENFDINRYRSESGNTTGDVYVTVTSSNGYLSAIYNDKNIIFSTYQKFKNVPLPYDVRNEVYASFKGWTVTKNKYVAYGKGNGLDSENYIVNLEKGKNREKIKITPARTSASGVAMVEKQ